MAILSIQSRVTSGYVGNAVAVPILQRFRHDVWPIDTVAYSNHPAHGAFTGGVRPAMEIAALAAGLDTRGLFADCHAVLSGYLGSAETGPVVFDVAARIRAAGGGAFWCCDPVMGDNGRFYVADGIPEFFRDLAIPAADIITPNVFEAEYLSGVSIHSAVDAVQAARVLRRAGPATVIVTGIREGCSIAAIAVTADGVWKSSAPFIDIPAHGAGDAFVALYVGHILGGKDTGQALALAVSGIHALLAASVTADDLMLVERLDDILAPPYVFGASAMC
ncbi:MAG: pyridoxal kinase [Alphaproteobacteria bacterium]